jgi:hypothetical protein
VKGTYFEYSNKNFSRSTVGILSSACGYVRGLRWQCQQLQADV